MPSIYNLKKLNDHIDLLSHDDDSLKIYQSTKKSNLNDYIYLLSHDVDSLIQVNSYPEIDIVFCRVLTFRRMVVNCIGQIVV